jgi:hypothetical protein
MSSAATAAAATPQAASAPVLSKTLYCSFCFKSQHEVRKLISGPASVFICDECVELRDHCRFRDQGFKAHVPRRTADSGAPATD